MFKKHQRLIEVLLILLTQFFATQLLHECTPFSLIVQKVDHYNFKSKWIPAGHADNDIVTLHYLTIYKEAN